MRVDFTSPRIRLTVCYCRCVREEVIRQFAYAEDDDRIATVNGRECIRPDTAMCIRLAIIVKTLATADRVVQIGVCCIAHVQFEHVDRIVVCLCLQTIHIDAGCPELFAAP